MKIYNKIFTICKITIMITIAPKGTCWYNQEQNLNSRTDDIVSIKRKYFRNSRKYAYSIYVGRLVVSFERLV